MARINGIYSSRGYVLGLRCQKGHSGNCRYSLTGPTRKPYLTCVGCGDWPDMGSVHRYPDRAAALAAERAIAGRPTWPDEAILRSVAALTRR